MTKVEMTAMNGETIKIEKGRMVKFSSEQAIARIEFEYSKNPNDLIELAKARAVFKLIDAAREKGMILFDVINEGAEVEVQAECVFLRPLPVEGMSR